MTEQEKTVPGRQDRKKYAAKACIKEPNSTGQYPIYLESAIVDNTPMYLMAGTTETNMFGMLYPVFEVVTQTGKTYRPLADDEIPYQPYSFTMDEMHNFTLYTAEVLYTKILNEVKHFIDAEERDQHLIAICNLFSYKQDKARTTPYLSVVGDAESGKSSVQHLFLRIGYRPLLCSSLTYANIYRYLGDNEPASGIILEDEVDTLDKEIEKKKIIRDGYSIHSKIPRMVDENHTTKQKFFNGFCFKALSGTKPIYDAQIVSRCLPIEIIEGFPNSNIKDPTPEEEERLVQLRKDLLIWRLLTANQALPSIKYEWLRNRPEELWKPLLSCVYETKYYETILNLCTGYVKNRAEEKSETLNGFLFNTVVEPLIKDGLVVTVAEMWNILKKHGTEVTDKTIDLDEYGKLSYHKLSTILKSHFKAKQERKGGKNTAQYVFVSDIVEKLRKKYCGVSGVCGVLMDKDKSLIGTNDMPKPVIYTPKDSTNSTDSTLKKGETIKINNVAFTYKFSDNEVHTANCEACGSVVTMKGADMKELMTNLKGHVELYHGNGV